MANLTLKNVAKVCATAQLKAPGAIDEIYWAPICDFTSIADLDGAVTDIDAYGLITTAHTFTGTKGFVKIDDIQENTAKFNFADQGGKGFGNWKVTGEAMGRTFNPKLIGLLNQAKFQPGIALVKLMNGQVMQIGSEKFPAYLTGDFDSNTNQSTEAFGVKLKVEADQTWILRYNYPTLAITIIT